MTDEQTFENYRNRLDIRDVLEDAGYTLYKRDGLRYPAYVRLDSDGYGSSQMSVRLSLAENLKI